MPTENVVRLFDEPKAVVLGDFDALWKVWPKKTGKVVARQKYVAILRGLKTRTLDKDSGTYIDIELVATPDQILAGAKAYLQTQKATGSGSFGYVDGGKWIPHLATYLNRGQFLDLIE